MFAFGVAFIRGCSTEFPIPWLILSLLIAFVATIPIGMIRALTAQDIPLNVLSEMIVGYGLPGRPLSMMLFKTWAYDTMYQAVTFSSDLKLGHYMKIPPRPMFLCQVIATIIAGTVQLGVQAWMFEHIPDFCDPSQKDGFTCPSTHAFGSASIIWGLIGPARQFSTGQIYHSLSIFFLVGALAPVLAYLISLRFPNSWIRYVK